MYTNLRVLHIIRTAHANCSINTDDYIAYAKSLRSIEYEIGYHNMVKAG